MATIPSFDIDKYLKPKYDIKETGLANQKAYKKYLLAHILKGTEVNRSPLEMIGNLAKVYAGADLLKTDDDATKLLQEKAKEKKQISADYLSTALKAIRKPFTSPSEVEDVLLRKSIEDPETGTATLPEYQNVPKIYPKGTTENLIARLQNSKNPALQDYAKQLMPYAMQVKEKRGREDKLREQKLLREQVDLAEKRQYEENLRQKVLLEKRELEEKNPQYTWKNVVTATNKDGTYTIQLTGINKNDPTKEITKGKPRTILPSKNMEVVTENGKTTVTWGKTKKGSSAGSKALEKAQVKAYTSVRNSESATRRFLRKIAEVQGLLVNPDGTFNEKIIGIAGKVASGINATKATVKGLMQYVKERTGEGQVFKGYRNSTAIYKTLRRLRSDPEMQASFKEAGIANARLQAHIISLGFMKAVAMQGGAKRISDADMKNAIKSIAGASLSARAMFSVLDDNKKELIENYNVEVELFNRDNPEFWKTHKKTIIPFGTIKDKSKIIGGQGQGF
jgi:hypothetical protein